ncbi:MAG: WD40 repeat domain-containing protein [Cyanobacteria bacterium P01_E01_bin.42]
MVSKQCLSLGNHHTHRVVLSLREDYLHYLLNCTRITDLSAINNDILSKNILYHLGNFSPEDAKEVIASLTERSQFHLESELVEAIVQELSEELREVRPIELQVVGAQMQAEGITTLEQYREFGTKEKLVERYLADVVKDCGEENKKLAEDILYLLTDENNTRPLKTRPELEAELKTLAADLKIEEARLTLILEIFVKSSLVFLLPENPCDRYQIFHDYLVAFIRKQRDFGLSAELKKEREKRQQSEAELNKVLKQQLKIAIGGGVLMTGLAILAGLFGIQANIGKTNAEVKEISAAAESLFASRKELDSLVEGLRAGKKLQQEVLKFGIEDNTKNQVIARLQEIVYGTNEINRLEGHSDTVKDIIFSPNGKFIASGGKDKKVILWNKSGEKIAELENHYKSITTLVFSPDSKILASGSEDNTIKLWSIKGEELKTLEGHSDKINQISFSPDGKTIASASSDGTVKLWNQDGSLVNTLTDHNSDVTLVQFSPNGKIIATVGKDDTIKLRTRNGNLRHSIGSFGVLKIKFQENSKILMGVSQDKTLKFWDLDGNLLKTTHEILWNAPSVINFSENAQKLVASDPWGQTHFWKIEDFNVEHLDYLLQSHPQNGTLSPDGNILAWVSRDNVIQTYNLDNQHFKTKEDERDRGNIIGFNLENLPVSIRDRTIKFWNLDGKLVKTIELSDPLEHLLFSPNGQTIVSAIVEAPAKLFNTVDGSLVKAFDKDILFSEFSPDGQLFVTTSWDNTAKLWKSDGKPIKLLEGHSDRITTVVFSPDSQIFATASQDKTAKLWNRNGKLIKTLKGHGDRIEKIVFSRDSQRIATTSRDNTVKLWDHKGQSIQTIDNYSYNHKEQWTRRETQIPHFSPDGQILFVPSHYNNVKLWDRDGKILTILKENDSPVFHTSFSPDSQTIATLNRNGTIKLWNRDGSLVKTIEGEHYGNVIAFSPDSQLIVSVVQSKVKLWTREGKLIKTLTGSASNIQFSPDSQTILSITGNDAILWNRQGQLIKIIKKYGDETPAISFNSKTGLLASTDRNNTIKLWNSKGKLIKTLTGHQAEITQLTFSKDGKTFISMDKENIVKTWRSNNGELLQAIKGHGYEGGRASLSNDGKTIAIFGFEDKIKLWDNEGNLLKTFKGHTDQIQSISLSLDNQLLASASKDKTVKLWNLDGTEIQTLEGHTKPVNSVSFSPDGKFLASASEDKTVKLWNRQGKLIDTLEGHRNSVREVRFSPNSQIVVSASDDNTIRLWDVRTKKELKILRGHSDSVTSIRFSQNGKTIASTSQDGDVKIWSNTGIMLMNFGWNSLRGNDINFSPDGKKIIAFGQEETLIWSLELDELLKLGCNKARDYLKTNPSVKESDRNLCDDIE